mmetsp:Transcript_21922/g.85908  ORF Transcript_21922/g.85908 Transcript_21922/m.85908 type:complete len:138 (-) Transcript_21922:168-581(-)|eukprot:CAMPEP_0114617508 /NCGR_PEP_ID=MMETSP0168-20121206/7233_1 /TAXON_ID=95228 ORGANISM="Vannella sp., Strain DIVA3 517/6/12" /NCGR_SAMPLE_ID=MMETSP0168 /ASSEMBLY_ACC=CAM_ASM_000044 /LENGTH=137 /DNA_ID=CAMNT_0001828645 /DNA_START=305 /DNA_END=718 /DNA_ORIENTATION=+
MGRKVEEVQLRKDLHVRARLKEMLLNSVPASTPSHYGLVMKYELLLVIDGDESELPFPYSKGDTVYIVHGAPLLPRSTYHTHGGSLVRFRVGDVHNLRLKLKIKDNPSPFDSMEDPYPHNDEPRYLCLRVDLARRGS